MKTYSLMCTCKDAMTTSDAASREEAVEKFKGMLTEDMISKHCAEKHPGEPVPSKEQTDAMIEKETKEEI